MDNEVDSSDKILEMAETLLKRLTSQQYRRYQSQHGQAKYRQMVQTEFKDMHYKYPAIFNKMFDEGDKFDMKMLRHILGKREAITKGEVSEESATAEFGKKMADKYVTPVTDKLG